jgi:hypothetical protein
MTCSSTRTTTPRTSRTWGEIRPGAHVLITAPADPSLWSAQ